MSEPRISVVCPAFNSAAFLAATLTSAAIQTRRPFEIVVVDDGSTDDTAAIARGSAAAHGEIRWQVLAGARRGPGAARNRGIRAASGEWIAFLDSDDLWLPRKMEVVMATIAARPEANVISHGVVARDPAGREMPSSPGQYFDPQAPFPRQLYRRNLFSTSTVVVRRQELLDAGLFDEALSSAQDYELWLRMAPRLRPWFVTEVLSIYVLRPGSITNSNRLRRARNQFLVAFRHRRLGTTRDFVRKAAWIFASLLTAPLRERCKKTG